MNSNVFSYYRALLKDESFLQDIKSTLEISESVLINSLQDILDLYLLREQQLAKKRSEEFATKYSVAYADVRSLARISSFFFRQFSGDGRAVDDDPSDIVQDFVDESIVSEESKKLVEYLTLLKRASGKDIILSARKAHAGHRASPKLESVDAVANFRPVFDKDYDPSEPADEYSPECLGVIPMALITLEFDDGPIDKIHFQADRADLDMLISSLIAITREFELGAKFLNLDREGIDNE